MSANVGQRKSEVDPDFVEAVIKALALVDLSEGGIGNVIAAANVVGHVTWVGKELEIVAVTLIDEEGGLLDSSSVNFVVVETSTAMFGAEGGVGNLLGLVAVVVGVIDAGAQFVLELEIEVTLVEGEHVVVVAIANGCVN